MGVKEPPRFDAPRQVLEERGVEVFQISGSIKWFDVAKGYGFVVPDGGLADVFVRVACLAKRRISDHPGRRPRRL